MLKLFIILDLQRKVGQTTLMEAAGFTVDHQRIIYSEFLMLTLPQLYISRDQFGKFMVSSLGWPEESLSHLFRSFNIRYRNNDAHKSSVEVT